jgi:predicted kinase
MSQPQRFDSQYKEPAQDQCAATMLLMVGLPGAGKTTRAKKLAAANRALRLTPDHWMIPLFGEPMADGKRFVLEGRLISVALQALRLGTSVVLDFGLWGRDERWHCAGWRDQPGQPAR